MDNSIVAVEESHRRESDSAASASKSLESLVRINSIAIDISSAMEEIESPAHEHFSIRGYVAGMREKDRNMCLPFRPVGNDGNLEDDLPPLVVPRHRWWQCEDCLPDIATGRSTEAVVVASRTDVGTSSRNNIGDEKDGVLLHSSENIGKKHGLMNYRDGIDNSPSTSIVVYSNACCTEGHNCLICSKDKADASHKEAGNPSLDIPVANEVHIREPQSSTAGPSNSVHAAVRPSCIVEETDNASSGSDGTLNALPNKRKPKLRSLADIMVEKRNPTSNNTGTRSASSSGVLVTCAETETVSAPQDELDAPAGVAKGNKSPQRKRKVPLEQDSGTSGKRLRGVVPDMEKVHQRAEISGSESEGDASTRLDLQFGEKVQRVKPRKTKALDISKRARLQPHIEEGSVPVRELHKMSDENAQKHAVAHETSFGGSGHVSGEMGQYFSGFLTGQQTERILDFNRSKRPESEADCARLIMPPPSRSVPGECSGKGKVALDLSLNSFVDAEKVSNDQSSSKQHRSIPDLNETFPYQTIGMQGKQMPTLSERSSLPLHNTWDISASCSTEAIREGKRQIGVLEPQNKDKSIERCGASDDIPMEIVELLARNQQERALGNSREQNLLPEGINNNSSFRGSSSLYLDGHRATMNFPLPSNRRSDLTATNGNFEARQNIPMNFSQLNNSQMDRNKEVTQFRIFSSSAQNQPRKTQYTPSSSIMTKSTRTSERPELLWLPRRENVPFHLSIPQNHSVPQSTMAVHSFSDLFSKGKTVSDVKGRRDEKKAINRPVLKDRAGGSSSKSVGGSLDPYSNETIPAMQLLSLMDQGMVTGSSFKVAPKSFLDKPFSPCNHHPKLNGNENQAFGPFFSQGSNSKDLSGLRYGVYTSGESSRKASSHLQGQIHPRPGKSKAANLEIPSNIAFRPARTFPPIGLCTLNRNPADFSVPDATNEYTISAKDLKPRKKRKYLTEKSRPMNVERGRKPKVRKEYS